MNDPDTIHLTEYLNNWEKTFRFQNLILYFSIKNIKINKIKTEQAFHFMLTIQDRKNLNWLAFIHSIQTKKTLDWTKKLMIWFKKQTSMCRLPEPVSTLANTTKIYLKHWTLKDVFYWMINLMLCWMFRIGR